MFWLLAIYGGTNLLKYFNIFATSPKKKYKDLSCKNIFKIENLLLMLMSFLMFLKLWKFTARKKLNYIFNIYFKFSKNLGKVYNDFKD